MRTTALFKKKTLFPVLKDDFHLIQSVSQLEFRIAESFLSIVILPCSRFESI